MRNQVADMRTAHASGSLLGLVNASAAEAIAKADEPVRLAADFTSRVDEINRDQRLTRKGQEDAKAAAGRSALAAGDKWLRPIDAGLDANEASLHATILASVLPKKPADLGDRMEQAFLRAEIRRKLDGLSPQQVEIAARLGDPLVLAAINEVPRVEARGSGVTVRPYLDEKTRDSIYLELAKERNPDVAATLHDLELLRGFFHVIAGTLRRVVFDAVPGLEDAWNREHRPPVDPATGLTIPLPARVAAGADALDA